jgi:hypothetical protein
MGLTISYNLRFLSKNYEKAMETVAKIRQLALDLPFQSVGEIVHLTGDACNYENESDGEKRWMLIQSGRYTQIPWNKGRTITVRPVRMTAFSIDPGDGCETANIGLCIYPDEISTTYSPEDDTKFFTDGKFDYLKWSKKRTAINYWETETRQLKTKLKGCSWKSFCKTQYASNPECGGVPNFLRCHIGLITLLDRVAKLPGLKVEINDEGRYGPSYYTDNWRVPEPVYTWHEGKYSPAELVKEINQWNNFIAAFAGSLKDIGCESPITKFANFEQLEFRGTQNYDVTQFLTVMKQLIAQ